MTSRPITATIYLERDDEIEVALDSFYTPAERYVYNLPNGATGEVLELTPGEREKAEEAIREEVSE